MTIALPALSSAHSFRRDTLTGMALAALSFACLSSVDTIFKLLTTEHSPPYQLLFLNGCFAMIPILLWAMARGGLSRLSTARLPLQLARGTVSVASSFAAIYAYSRLQLTDFYAIVFAGPLIVTAMGAFWLGEKVDGARWLAVFTGFVGIMIIVNPFASPLLHVHAPAVPVDTGAITLGRLAAFVSVFCYALSVIMIRRMRTRETSLSFCFYGYVASLTICGVMGLLHGMPHMSSVDLAHLAFSGTMGGIASICMITAYHRTPVALVAPFQYTQIFWGALAGYLIWQHVPSINLVIGAGVVALCGFYVIQREMKAPDVVS